MNLLGRGGGGAEVPGRSGVGVGDVGTRLAEAAVQGLGFLLIG